jgi:hypothetical protein
LGVGKHDTTRLKSFARVNRNRRLELKSPGWQSHGPQDNLKCVATFG